MTRRDRKAGHREGHFLLLALRNQPLTREAISGTYHRFGALLGISTPAPGTKRYEKWQREVNDGLKHCKSSAKMVHISSLSAMRD